MEANNIKVTTINIIVYMYNYNIIHLLRSEQEKDNKYNPVTKPCKHSNIFEMLIGRVNHMSLINKYYRDMCNLSQRLSPSR